jgi:hypothetical protein
VVVEANMEVDEGNYDENYEDEEGADYMNDGIYDVENVEMFIEPSSGNNDDGGEGQNNNNNNS